MFGHRIDDRPVSPCIYGFHWPNTYRTMIERFCKVIFLIYSQIWLNLPPGMIDSHFIVFFLHLPIIDCHLS